METYIASARSVSSQRDDITDSCPLSPDLCNYGVNNLSESYIHAAREYQSPLPLSKPLRVEGCRLKRVLSCAQKKDMTADADLASLRHEELVALVQQLRQQIVKRDQEIEYLKRQLAETRTPSAWQEPVPASA